MHCTGEKKIIEMLEEVRRANEARAEAEQASLERLREIGMVNARGIIEWAETRSKKTKTKRMDMNRFHLWSDIIKDNPGLANCLEQAGWPRGTLASNMLGLYASLSSDVHKGATPLVSDAIGGVIISVNDTGSGVNATAAKVLLCLARANFIRARLQGARAEPIEVSEGLNNPKTLDAYLAEEAEHAQLNKSQGDQIMR